MRPITLIIAAVLMASIAAAASWKEYPQPQLGFVVEYPAEPATSTGSYRTGLVTSAPAQIFTVKEDHALYVATVVDLQDVSATWRCEWVVYVRCAPASALTCETTLIASTRITGTGRAACVIFAR